LLDKRPKVGYQPRGDLTPSGWTEPGKKGTPRITAPKKKTADDAFKKGKRAGRVSGVVFRSGGAHYAKEK